MNDEYLSTAYGLAALIIAIAILVGVFTQQVWLVIAALLATTIWSVTGFLGDIWKDGDE